MGRRRGRERVQIRRSRAIRAKANGRAKPVVARWYSKTLLREFQNGDSRAGIAIDWGSVGEARVVRPGRAAGHRHAAILAASNQPKREETNAFA